MHSGGFELTKLTCTRLEDYLIRHRGDRYTVMPNRHDRWGSGAVEIATGNVFIPSSSGLAKAHSLTQSAAMRNSLPPDLVQLLSTLPIRALAHGDVLVFEDLKAIGHGVV